MTRTLSFLIGLAGPVLLAFTPMANAGEVEAIPVGGKIQWIYSYEDGQKVARQTGKPMFVVFRCER